MCREIDADLIVSEKFDNYEFIPGKNAFVARKFERIKKLKEV